jgi:c-di-GMP-binding flagellar brake protein YcgR
MRASMLNQRKEKRFNEENDVLIQYMLKGNKSSNYLGISALTRDISLSGAKIIAKKLFPISTILRIQISLARSKQVIKVDGKIKWIKERAEKDSYEIGIEFMHEISKTVLSLIRHLYTEETGIPSKII